MRLAVFISLGFIVVIGVALLIGSRTQNAEWTTASCETRIGMGGDAYVYAHFDVGTRSYMLPVARHGALLYGGFADGLDVDPDGKVRQLDIAWEHVLPRTIRIGVNHASPDSVLAAASLDTKGIRVSFSDYPHCLDDTGRSFTRETQHL